MRKSSLSALLWDEAFVTSISPLQNKFFKRSMTVARYKLHEKVAKLSIFFPKHDISMFLLKNITKPNQRNRILKAGAGQSTCYPRPWPLEIPRVGMAVWGSPPEPHALAAVFPSLPGLIVLLTTLWELFLHNSLAKKSLPPLFFLEYFRSKSNRNWSKPGLGSMGKGSSGWRLWGKHHLGHSRRVCNSTCYPRILIKLG